MNIEEQKEKFLDLLRTAYKAKQSRLKTEGLSGILNSHDIGESLDNFEQENRVKINEDALAEFGLQGTVFWEIICPSLKEEGYIEDFGDPNNIPEEYYKRFDRYEKLKKKLKELEESLPASYSFSFAKVRETFQLGNEVYNRMEDGRIIKSIENEIEKTEKEYNQVLGLARKLYPFFVINEDKLINDDTNKESKLKFDSQNGVLRCGNIKPYSFHRGTNGEKPRLKFFRKLWDERRFIRNGVVKKKGEAFPVRALAIQVGVSENKIKEMVKSINRVLKQKRFPAEIEQKNGILLIVTEK